MAALGLCHTSGELRRGGEQPTARSRDDLWRAASPLGGRHVVCSGSIYYAATSVTVRTGACLQSSLCRCYTHNYTQNFFLGSFVYDRAAPRARENVFLPAPPRRDHRTVVANAGFSWRSDGCGPRWPLPCLANKSACNSRRRAARPLAPTGCTELRGV